MDEIATLWWRQAIEDLVSAKANIAPGRYYISALMAQQAVEKALKAPIIAKSGELVKSHDLVHLAAKVCLPQGLVDLCDGLSKVYLTARYPDAYGDIPSESFTHDDAVSDIKAAEEVIAWVKKRM